MLGMSALGIETDEWACATARAAGHDCLQADVAALDPRSLGRVWGVIGSAPCQAYSSAGKGLGRLDKPLVIACAHKPPPATTAARSASPNAETLGRC